MIFQDLEKIEKWLKEDREDDMMLDEEMLSDKEYD